MRTRQYFFSYNPAYSKIMPEKPFKTVCPPCFAPPIVGGYYFCFKGWENSFQKTRMFFGALGSRNIRKQIILYYHQNPPSHLEKDRCGDNPPSEETDRINQSLACISSAAILFFRFLRPSPYQITKAGSCEESSLVYPKYEAATGWKSG